MTDKEALEKIVKLLGQNLPNSNRLASYNMTPAAMKRWMK